jgi:glycosyltransferase involved in cell wall biosynthesis
MPNYPVGKIHPGYGGLFKREDRSGVRLIRTYIYPTQSAGLIRRLANYFSFVFSASLFGSLFLRKADYLLVESPPLFLGLAALWLSWVKRTKLIFNVSDLWPESVVRLGMLREHSFAHRVASKIEALCCRRAWLVTGQSRSILKSIKERFPECEVFHLSNGVNTKSFGPECSDEKARTLLKRNGNCIALYAGLHGLAQGLDQILKTAEGFTCETPVDFVLIGDGPEKGRLIEQAKKRRLTNLKFLDLCPAKEMPALLASVDLALITLKSYIPGAVPSKLYEAMASGLPVVLVAEGEASEIVEKYDAGIVVQPGNIDALTNAIRQLVSDPGMRHKLGANGQKAAREHFDRTIIADEFIDHLEANLKPAIVR